MFNYILAEPSAHPENSLEIANLYARCFSWKHEDLQGFTRNEKIESAIVEAVEMEICKGHYKVSVVFSIFIISRVLSLVLRCLSGKGKVLLRIFLLRFSLLHSRVRRYGFCICGVCYSLKCIWKPHKTIGVITNFPWCGAFVSSFVSSWCFCNNSWTIIFRGISFNIKQNCSR